MKQLLYVFTSMLISSLSHGSELQIMVQDSSGKPASNIVVVVIPKSIKAEKRQERLTISQIDKAFSPYMTVMQTGQPLEFSNSDDITHHIFSASRTQNFSFKIRKGQRYSAITFDSPTSISMGCNIHDWMSGHILIVDTPYFILTNKDGIASIIVDELGEATIKTWHPQMNKTDIDTRKQILLPVDNMKLKIKLKQSLGEIPDQMSGDNFDFLDDY